MRKAVYTVITGGYDKLKDPKFVQKNWDYVCFSDRDIKSKVWKVVKINGKDKRRLSRLPKIKWFDFLDYDITIYVDASYKLKINLDKILAIGYKPGYHNAFRHWDRDCVYTEAMVILKMQKDDFNPVSDYIKLLMSKGYPENNGLMANGFMIRDKQLPKNPYLNWWKDVEKYSCRDQLSFMPNAEDLKLNFINPKLRFKFFRSNPHESIS